MSSQYDVSGKIAIVTGGAAGLGAALTAELVRENAKHVIFLDISNKGVDTESKISSKYGVGKATFIQCDVANGEQLAALYKQVVDTYNRIDIVFNNAGIFDETKSGFKKMIDVNFTAVVDSTLTALEVMRSDCGGPGGTIVNIASIAALVDSHMFPIYGAAKSAVLYFGNSIGTEANYSRTKVRVLSICLGGTDTDIVPSSPEKTWDHRIRPDLELVSTLIKLQSAEDAARASLEVLKRGVTADTWVVSDGVAKDITSTVRGNKISLEQFM